MRHTITLCHPDYTVLGLGCENVSDLIYQPSVVTFEPVPYLKLGSEEPLSTKRPPMCKFSKRTLILRLWLSSDTDYELKGTSACFVLNIKSDIIFSLTLCCSIILVINSASVNVV